MILSVGCNLIQNCLETGLRFPVKIALGIIAIHHKPRNVVRPRADIGFGCLSTETRIAPCIEIGERYRVIAPPSCCVDSLTSFMSGTDLELQQSCQVARVQCIPDLLAGPIEP